MNFIAPLNSLGFGIYAFGYLRAFQNSGIKVNLHPIGSDKNKLWEGASEASELAETFGITKYDSYIKNPLSSEESTLILWHPDQIVDYAIEGSTNYGYTHFETSDFASDHRKKLKLISNKIESIHVSNQWASDILNSYGISSDPIIYGPAMPLYINTSTLDPFNKLYNATRDKLTLMSSGKWEVRKGHLKLVEWLSEYNEPINLIGLWANPFSGGLDEPIRHIVKYGFKFKTSVNIPTELGSKLNIYTNDIGTNIILFSYIPKWIDTLSIYKCCDCFVSISSGEGWDLPLVEAMALKIPVMATYNTAHCSYIEPENSFVVDTSTEIALDKRWFNGKVGEWYPAKKESFNYNLELLHTLYKSKPDKLTQIGISGYETIRSICSLRSLGDQLKTFTE
jgi:glycosyltransferase involved in cell wall biosynthesis